LSLYDGQAQCARRSSRSSDDLLNLDLARRVGDAPHLGHLGEIRSDELRIASTRAGIFSAAPAPRASSRPVMITDAPFFGHRPCGGDTHPGGATVIKARLSFGSIADIPSHAGTYDPFEMIAHACMNGPYDPIMGPICG
jgi:hypothetical protein